jgi:hypothetical protein
MIVVVSGALLRLSLFCRWYFGWLLLYWASLLFIVFSTALLRKS